MVDAQQSLPIRVAIMSHSVIANATLRYCLAQQADLMPLDLRDGHAFVHCKVVVVHCRLPQHLRASLAGLGRVRADLKLVMLCAPADPFRLASLLQQGFDGYVKRGEPYDVLLDVIRRVARGEPRLDPEVLDVVLAAIRADASGLPSGLSRKTTAR